MTKGFMADPTNWTTRVIQEEKNMYCEIIYRRVGVPGFARADQPFWVLGLEVGKQSGEKSSRGKKLKEERDSTRVM